MSASIEDPAEDLLLLSEDDEAWPHAYHDVIEVEMFQAQIPVFTDRREMIETLISIGTDAKTAWIDEGPCFGMATTVKDSSGADVFALYLDPEADASVWVHEASHLVDFIFDSRGISTCMASTETRAYMLGWIFKEIARIMNDFVLAQERSSAIIH